MWGKCGLVVARESLLGKVTRQPQNTRSLRNCCKTSSDPTKVIHHQPHRPPTTHVDSNASPVVKMVNIPKTRKTCMFIMTWEKKEGREMLTYDSAKTALVRTSTPFVSANLRTSPLPFIFDDISVGVSTFSLRPTRCISSIDRVLTLNFCRQGNAVQGRKGKL